MTNSAYIYDAVRSARAIAKPHGGLHDISASELLKQLYSALKSRNDIPLQHIEDVILGCVTQYGEQAGNIARTSAIYAQWPDQIPGISVNRFCSSSLDAVCLAADKIRAGSNQMLVTGGVESMSRTAMFSDQPNWMLDPASIAANRTIPLGGAADFIATKEGFTRSDLDRYAIQSQQRAAQAIANGCFINSIVPIENPDMRIFDTDEAVRPDVTLEQLAGLEPAFAEIGKEWVDEALRRYTSNQSQLAHQLSSEFQIDHQHTVGNSPAMVDGASVLLIAKQTGTEILSSKPRAKILAHRSACGPVEEVLTGGIIAAQQLLDSLGMKNTDLDLIEFNESFAGPTLKFIRDMAFDPEIVNVNGGAIALGHPMGATGGNLISMLLDELERRDQETGMVSICGATGSGTAMIIQRC